MAIDWSKYQPTTTNAPTSNKVDWSKYGGGVQETQPEKKTDFFGGVTTFLKGLTMLPKSIAASVLQATQGKKGASVVERDWADNFISSVGSDMDRFVQETRGKYGEAKLLPGMPFKITDIASLPQNMAFSITSMGAGLGAGVPTALVPLPGMRVAAWAAGTAASGAAAYSSTTYQIMQQYLEGKDSEKRAKTGKGLTKEEEVALKDDFDKKAHEYGLWEAVPEAISNLGFGKLLQPLTKVAGKAIAGKMVTFLAGTYGTELLTETVTQKGQSAIEVEAGLREGKLTWTEAFKEIFPQTFLLTTVFAGAGATGATAMRNYQAKVNASLEEEAKKKRIPLDGELYQETKRQIDQGFTELQGERGKPMEEQPTQIPQQPTQTDLVQEADILRGTKGLTADDIMKTYPNIKLTKDIPATDLYGKKVEIPKGEKLTPYELKGNKILLQDGETYIVSKNQFQNIKGQSVVAEGKPFAPELEGVEETVKADYEGAEQIRKQRGIPSGELLEGIDKTKYSQYQLPEGKEYGEILIRAPGGKIPKTLDQLSNENYSVDYRELNVRDKGIIEKIFDKQNDKNVFKSSHWDELNVIAHIRRNFRTYKGKKVYFVEEIQSDWAREGRDKGFGGLTEADIARQKELLKIPSFQLTDAQNKELKSLTDKASGVPNNPLLKNWQELSIKRALKDAVDSKAEYFAWINGEQTSARYNLATHVEKVEWYTFKNTRSGTPYREVGIQPKGSTTGKFWFEFDNTGKITTSDRAEWQGKKLDEVLGKGLADKIMADEAGTLSGEGLKFGGEWANNLYDKQVPNLVKDLTGAEIVKIDMGLPIEKQAHEWTLTRTGKPLLKSDLRVGNAVIDYKQNANAEYIITDILGDGKFKAVPKQRFNGENINLLIKGEHKGIIEGRSTQDLFNYSKETFDISIKKSAGQQAIRLTQEVKNKIKGIAPKIKTSGKMFNQAVKTAPVDIAKAKSEQFTTPITKPTTSEGIKIKDIETLKERLTDENGKLDPVFEGSTVERQYELANKLVAEVGEKTAIDIANKIIPLPKGYEEIRPAALARLLAESENLTFEGYNRLMDNPNETPYSISEAGSSLSLSRAKGEFNPVDVARDVEKTRAKQAKKTGEKAVPSKSDLKNIIKKNLMC